MNLASSGEHDSLGRNTYACERDSAVYRGRQAPE